MLCTPETNIINQLYLNLKSHMFWMLLHDVGKMLLIKVENKISTMILILKSQYI